MDKILSSTLGRTVIFLWLFLFPIFMWIVRANLNLSLWPDGIVIILSIHFVLGTVLYILGLFWDDKRSHLVSFVVSLLLVIIILLLMWVSLSLIYSVK